MRWEGIEQNTKSEINFRDLSNKFMVDHDAKLNEKEKKEHNVGT